MFAIFENIMLLQLWKITEMFEAHSYFPPECSLGLSVIGLVREISLSYHHQKLLLLIQTLICQYNNGCSCFNCDTFTLFGFNCTVKSQKGGYLFMKMPWSWRNVHLLYWSSRVVIFIKSDSTQAISHLAVAACSAVRPFEKHFRQSILLILKSVMSLFE